MSNRQRTRIQWTPCRRFTWQKVLNFSFVSREGQKKRIQEVNLIFIVNMTFRATGYFYNPSYSYLLSFTVWHSIQFGSDGKWIICNMCVGCSFVIGCLLFYDECWNVRWFNCQCKQGPTHSSTGISIERLHPMKHENNFRHACLSLLTHLYVFYIITRFTEQIRNEENKNAKLVIHFSHLMKL